jgi:hypothetical protein
MNQYKPGFRTAALIAAVFVVGCSSSDDAPPPGQQLVQQPAPVEQVTRVELLSSSTRAMNGVVFNGSSAYVPISNSATEVSSVLRTSLPVQASSSWTPVDLGSCALGQKVEHAARTPSLTQSGGQVWLFQWSENRPGTPEHALCALDTQGARFTPRDQGLQACFGDSCSTLSMTDLKFVGSRMYTNAGGGENLLVSDNQAANWRAVLGRLDVAVCTPQAFHVIGDRLLVGGECPLDFAFIRAYQLTTDGTQLASPKPLPVTVPELENRNVQFIEPVPGTQLVFAGVEGGLLRSDDGGRTFKFVIKEPFETKSYPYIGKLLAPTGKANTVVVGGFDKVTGKPYLAWSADAGEHWTDISAMLPGYSNNVMESGTNAQVTGLAQDSQGRLFVTVNEEAEAKGHLMLLTLGKP